MLGDAYGLQSTEGATAICLIYYSKSTDHANGKTTLVGQPKLYPMTVAI